MRDVEKKIGNGEVECYKDEGYKREILMSHQIRQLNDAAKSTKLTFKYERQQNVGKWDKNGRSFIFHD